MDEGKNHKKIRKIEFVISGWLAGVRAVSRQNSAIKLVIMAGFL
jgi:hypothetical protein